MGSVVEQALIDVPWEDKRLWVIHAQTLPCEAPHFHGNLSGQAALLWAGNTQEPLMPRFFFHLRGDGQNFDDAIGSEFESVQQAEMAALRAASHMLEEAKTPPSLRTDISRSLTGMARVSASYPWAASF